MLTPRPYQQTGAQFLAARFRALLADEPGVGKTGQALLALKHAKTAHPHASVLILCPAIARYHWWRQAEAWGAATADEIGAIRTQADRPTTRIVLCSYDLAVRPTVQAWLLRQTWHILILDESQYLKDPRSKRSRLVWAHLTPKTPYVWCLSGTPARNHAGDLWPMLHAFNAYPFGWWKFVSDFLHSRQTIYGLDILGTRKDRLPALKALLAPLMLRRTKAEVLSQLPPLTYDTLIVDPAPLPAGVVPSPLPEILSTPLDDEALADVLHHQTVALAPSRRLQGMQKAPTVAALVAEELKEGQYEKIVLFAWHRDVIQLLMARLRDYHPLCIMGGVTAQQKEDALTAFREQARHQVMVAQIAAAGVAIDMSAATECLLVECSYVPSDNAQALMRVHRYPQTRPVRCRFVSLSDSSIDQRITQIVRRKTEDLSAVFTTTNH